MALEIKHANENCKARTICKNHIIELTVLNMLLHIANNVQKNALKQDYG